MTWPSIPGEKYQVEQTVNLRAWIPATNIIATGTKTSFAAPVSHTSPARFYRIKQIPR